MRHSLVAPMTSGVDPTIWIVLALILAVAVMSIATAHTYAILADTSRYTRTRHATARLLLVLHDLADEHPDFVRRAQAWREGRNIRGWAQQVEVEARASHLPGHVLNDVVFECRHGIWSNEPLTARATAPRAEA